MSDRQPLDTTMEVTAADGSKRSIRVRLVPKGDGWEIKTLDAYTPEKGDRFSIFTPSKP